MTVSAPTTAGQILTSAYVNNNINPGLDYITETSGSAISSLSVNTCFTSTYTNYRIVGNVTVSAIGNKLGFRYRAGGVDNSAASYTWVGTNLSSSAGTPSSTLVGGQAVTLGFFAYKASTAAYATGFVIDVYNPFNASVNKAATYQSTNVTGSIDILQGGFALASATAFDGFSFISESGTMTISAKIYGYRQA